MPKPRLSSCVLLAREDGDELRILWAKRREHMRFLGGFHAFPGGGLELEDEHEQWSSAPPEGIASALFGCAARELFEELGLFVLSGHGATSVLEEGAPLSAMRAWREELLASERGFAARLAVEQVALARERYLPIGRWTTPAWAPLRFETEFFLVVLDAEEVARVRADELVGEILTDELERAEWLSPAGALAAHRRGEALLTSPTIALLRHLDAARDARQPGRADQRAVEDMRVHAEFVGETYCVPLRSPTLPPATHTNCFVIGDERLVVIDPGSEEDAELTRLFSLLDALRAEGRELEAILLTHHHPDHICGVPKLRARYGDVPIWAHAANDELLADVGARVDRALVDGEVLDLGANHTLECVFTPGHAPGHMAFLHRETETMFCGDLIASQGTILVRPPRGHMGEYMASLERVREMNVRALHPAHGWSVTAPRQKLDAYIAHRQEREEQVFEALARRGAAWSAPLELVPAVYQDVPKHVWPLAAMSLAAHLLHLEELGRAERRDRESMAFRTLDPPAA